MRERCVVWMQFMLYVKGKINKTHPIKQQAALQQPRLDSCCWVWPLRVVMKRVQGLKVVWFREAPAVSATGLICIVCHVSLQLPEPEAATVDQVGEGSSLPIYYYLEHVWTIAKILWLSNWLFDWYEKKKFYFFLLVCEKNKFIWETLLGTLICISQNIWNLFLWYNISEMFPFSFPFETNMS